MDKIPVLMTTDKDKRGYYHINKEHLDYIKQSQAWQQVTMISGEAYAY